MKLIFSHLHLYTFPAPGPIKAGGLSMLSGIWAKERSLDMEYSASKTRKGPPTAVISLR